MKTLQANYVKDFVCDPRYCKAYCCKDQNIRADEKTVSKYKHIKPPAKSKEIMQHIKKNHIVFENGVCPFFNEETRLCSLAEEYNEEYMPNFCKTYPYYYTNFNEIFTVSLSLTCPVCCNLVLKQKAPIDAVIEDLSFKDLRIVREYSFPKTKLLYFSQKYGAQILQNEDYSLDDRLELLKIYLLGLQNISNTDELFKYSGEFTENIKNESEKLTPFDVKRYFTQMTFILFRLFSENGVAADSKSIGLTVFPEKVLELPRINEPEKAMDFDKTLALFEERFLPAKKVFERNFQNEITNMLTHIFLLNQTPFLPRKLSFEESVNYLKLQYDYMMFIMVSAYYILEEDFDYPTLCKTVGDLAEMFENDRRIIDFFTALSTGV